jgi:hypothetical protein
VEEREILYLTHPGIEIQFPHLQIGCRLSNRGTTQAIMSSFSETCARRNMEDFCNISSLGEANA